jgi:hypothetical protein
MVRSQPAGIKVTVGNLEENAKRYIGQTINVTAEVEDVFGPRLFKIDERNWGDMDGEVLVYLPSDFAALVREDDRVTVTGTMKMFMKADLERELGWLEPEPDVEIEFAERPVLVASRIVGGNSDVALAIKVSPAASGSNKADERTVGTSGKTGGETSTPLTDAAGIAKGDRDLVGRRVVLDNVKVSRAAKDHGFWIDAGGANVFVLPAGYAEQKTTASTGQTLSIEGVVLEMPQSMRDKAREVTNGNDDIYVLATTMK